LLWKAISIRKRITLCENQRCFSEATGRNAVGGAAAVALHDKAHGLPNSQIITAVLAENKKRPTFVRRETFSSQSKNTVKGTFILNQIEGTPFPRTVQIPVNSLTHCGFFLKGSAAPPKIRMTTACHDISDLIP